MTPTDVRRPRLLDLYCGSGGAGMGYHRAGFDVTGIDLFPMPRYPFAFVQADAVEYLKAHGREYDAIHASPPCQRYSRATAWRGRREDHPDLIGPTRQALLTTGLPYVIENVPDARGLLRDPVMLCGSMFGLRIRRHRYFEAPTLVAVKMPPCRHQADDYSFDHGKKQSERVYADAMGCEWMTVHGAREAIPPAYTDFLGRLLMESRQKEAA